MYRKNKSQVQKKREKLMKIEDELRKRQMQNLGRWCRIEMKKDGKIYNIVRTGYKSMEYPERDSQSIVNEAGDTIAEFNDRESLWGVANWIYNY